MACLATNMVIVQCYLHHLSQSVPLSSSHSLRQACQFCSLVSSSAAYRGASSRLWLPPTRAKYVHWHYADISPSTLISAGLSVNSFLPAYSQPFPRDHRNGHIASLSPYSRYGLFHSSSYYTLRLSRRGISSVLVTSRWPRKWSHGWARRRSDISLSKRLL